MVRGVPVDILGAGVRHEAFLPEKVGPLEVSDTNKGTEGVYARIGLVQWGYAGVVQALEVPSELQVAGLLVVGPLANRARGMRVPREERGRQHGLRALRSLTLAPPLLLALVLLWRDRPPHHKGAHDVRLQLL